MSATAGTDCHNALSPQTSSTPTGTSSVHSTHPSTRQTQAKAPLTVPPDQETVERFTTPLLQMPTAPLLVPMFTFALPVESLGSLRTVTLPLTTLDDAPFSGKIDDSMDFVTTPLFASTSSVVLEVLSVAMAVLPLALSPAPLLYTMVRLAGLTEDLVSTTTVAPGLAC
jgi:hypothetical protein